MTPSTHTHTFHTTRWTLIGNARGESPEAREALSELCASYYGPVVSFLRREGRDEDAARELAHEFFARLLAGDSLDGVDRERGRFRSYLLGAVKHFLANHRRDAAREKRGGGAEHLIIRETLETTAESGVADAGSLAVEVDQDAAFDREWALAIVERSLALLEAECASAGQSAQLTELKAWLSPAATRAPQADIAARLGLSEGALKVAIHRLRRRFREITRAEVAQTLHDMDDLDDEMRHLVDALAA
jgi:RNA polymerase sigma-70 factor (ECF subfamily)